MVDPDCTPPLPWKAALSQTKLPHRVVVKVNGGENNDVRHFGSSLGERQGINEVNKYM